MSKYTTQLRFICETEAGLTESVGENSVDTIILTARPKIFNFDYPIFDTNYKEIIESKILSHYYLREICAETYGVWKLFLKNKMREIMPYYNKLYESEKLKFDPLTNNDYRIERDLRRDSTGTEEGVYNGRVINTLAGTSKTDNNTENWNLYSDTPQGAIGNLDDETYLTNATKNVGEYHGITKDDRTNTDVSDSENNINRVAQDIESIVMRYTGKNGGTDFADLLVKYRESLLNIDMMVIDECSDLFFNLW